MALPRKDVGQIVCLYAHLREREREREREKKKTFPVVGSNNIKIAYSAGLSADEAMLSYTRCDVTLTSVDSSDCDLF